MAAPTLPGVGEAARVRWQDAARRATVACALEDGRVEVIFDDDGSEAAVPTAAVRPLEAFEAAPAACTPEEGGAGLAEGAGRCREEGNALFRLSDAAAAAERYTAAINALGRAPRPAGPAGPAGAARQVLCGQDRALWLATAAWAEGEEVGEVTLERPVGGRGFEGRASSTTAARTRHRGGRERVLVVQDGPLGDLQAALYLNRARCWLALHSPARAVQDCDLAAAFLRAQAAAAPGRGEQYSLLRLAWPALPSAAPLAALALLALAVALLLADEVRWASAALLLALLAAAGAAAGPRPAAGDGAGDGAVAGARLCTACFLRGKARLLQGRLGAAEAELRAAKAAAAPEQARDLERLRGEVAAARRGNKRLAKEVARWCEAAMARASPDAFAAPAEAAEDPEEAARSEDEPAGAEPRPGAATALRGAGGG